MMILEHWRLVIFILLCFVTLIQLAYYLVLFSRLAFYKPKQRLEHQEQPVSVVVCARDEASNIVKNLPGVLVQDYRTTHEVILVNDNSIDDSKFLIEELQKTFKNLVNLPLTQEAKLMSGKKFPLSMGIRTAKHETLLLTDADCVPASENWMKLMQNGYSNGTEIVLGYGAHRKAPGMLNKIIRFETFHSALQYFSYALAGLPYMGVGRNLSYRKDVFLRNKGFSSINQIPGGDDDLFINQVANKKNTSIVVDAEAHTISDAKRNWNDWLKQKYRHYSTAKYYRGKHKFLLGLYSATQFLVYPLTIAAAIFYSWWLALIIFGVRLVVQALVFNKTMKQLNEKDLFPMFILLDMWMCVYYVLFIPALFKRPKKTWN